MINKKSISLGQLALASVLMLSACSDPDITINQEDVKGIEMVGIRPALTRAGEVAELKDYVGRSEFDDKDRAVFCTIKRTEQAINQFTYKDIEFICAATTSEQGITSIGWSRDKTKGTTAQGGTESAPDRIYWSDAVNPHTFIGFCKPQQGEGNPEFDWGLSGQFYYGSIGDPTITQIPSEEGSETLLPAVIDFRSTFDGKNHEIRSGNDELRKNDILLTYSEEIKADDAIALLKFYHGLAQVRVIVNISDFAASGKDDTKSIVSDMILKDMLTMYKWSQTNVATVKLVESDQTALNGLYGTTKPDYDQRKNFKLWIPEPSGVGKDASKTFTFYGLAVPTTIPTTDADKLAFSFKVTYPNPMKPTVMKEHIYNASIGGIKFDAGKCTTINISLNHKNEKMTIGAQYDDWEFENTPDQGELKKNSTFMASTDRVWNTGGFNEDITIIGDAKATVDDATWLYVDQKTKKIVDVYGNDGSVGKPFQISTAEQLLSFAYEVKGDKRVSTLYKDLGGAEKTLSGSFDFTGYNVTLDAGLTLQPTEKKTKEELLLKKVSTESDEYKAAASAQSWIGIGDTGKPFNGTFNGGVRLISRLYGSPFFAELGPQAHIDQLILEDVIGVQGHGGFANINKGIICACKVDGDVSSAVTDHTPVGSFVGTNSGLIFACYHIGDLTAEGAEVVGGLVGCNKEGGQIVASYNAGKITANKTWKNGVLGKNEVTAGEPSVPVPSIFGCFYDTTKATGVSNVAISDENATSSDFPSYGKTTVELMKASFVGAPSATYVLTGENPEPTLTLNGLINSWVGANKDVLNARQTGLADHLKARYYVSQPAGYPWVY